MNQAWPTKRLADVCQILGGATPSKKNLKFYGGDIPWATVGDMNVEVITTTEECITKAAVADCSTNVIPSGSIVMATRVGLGKVCVLGQDTAINQDLKGLTPKNTNELTTRWLFWWLKSKASDIQKAGTGATVQGVKMTFVQELEIPLPPLAEQKRIVALLDEAFAAIDAAKAKAEANLNSSSGLFDMVREDIMREPEANTPSCSFDEICKIESALVDPRENEFTEKLHVGGANIESKTGRLLALQTARQEGLKSGKFPFQKGMVLYSKIRPNLMKVARPDFDGLCSADMYPLAPVDGRVCRDYLYHLLLTERFTRFALLGSERAGMPKVNRDYLSRFATKLPSISEQHAFASKLDALELSLRALRELLTKKMAALQELKSSLLTQAFAGELTA